MTASADAPGCRPGGDLRSDADDTLADAHPSGGLAPGSVADGRFLVGGTIGRGAMGAVYAAEDLSLGRRVALKVLLPQVAANAEQALRFRREARAIASLHSPWAVRLHFFGFCEDGSAYLAMELVDGEPPAAIVAREAPLPLGRVLVIVRRIADVLVDAHGQQLFHRDLKPANVLIARRGCDHDVVKVVDFGLSGVGAAAGADVVTRTGVVLGTPAYMAPEQVEGKGVGPPADLFALGVMAYELLLGVRPYPDQSLQAAIFARVTSPPRPPREANPNVALAPGVEALLLALLSRDPAQRPSARGLLDALERIEAATVPESETVAATQRVVAPGPGRPAAPLGRDAEAAALTERLERLMAYGAPGTSPSRSRASAS